MADKPTNKSPDDIKTATGLLGPLLPLIKTMFGFDLTSFLSLLAPKIRREAEALANKMKKNMPTDHWLRSDLVEMGIDFVSSRINAIADGQTKGVHAVLHEAAEFIKAFGQAFCGESDASKSGTAPTKPQASKPTGNLDKFVEDALKVATVKLNAATSDEELEKAQKQVLAIGQTLSALKVLLTDGPKEKAPRVKKVKPLTPAEKAEADEKEAKRWPNRLIAKGKELVGKGKELGTKGVGAWKKSNEALDTFNDQQAIRIAQIKATRKATPPIVPTPRNGIIDRALTSSLRGVGRFLGVCR